MATFKINGKTRSVDEDADTPLLWVIRETLGMTGTKFGCGVASCGACTVYVNGRAERSCTLPLSAAEGADITTIEGASGPAVAAVRDAAPDWEPYALEVLAGLLTGGESARLRSRLVRGQQVAASVSAGYNILARLPMLFTFSGTPARGRSVAELEEALRKEIRELRAELADEDELRRVKAQAEASRWYELDSFYYQALVIGLLESVGLSWQVQEEYVERIRAVTAEQVREVARKYLQDDMLTVVELEPLPLEAGAGRQRAAAEGGRHVR